MLTISSKVDKYENLGQGEAQFQTTENRKAIRREFYRSSQVFTN